MKNLKVLAKRASAAAATVGAIAITSGAHAAIDLGDSTSSFSDGTTAAATLGGLALALVVGIRIFKKIRGAV